MKICLDIQSAVGQRAGIGRYAHSLATHLAAESGPNDALTLFAFDFRRRGLPFAAPGARIRTCRLLPGTLAQKAWTRLNGPAFDRFAGPHDLFHFPNFVIPPLRRGRAVVTIHDISFLRFPEFADAANQRYLESTLPRTLARADAILTDSRFCAREITDLLGVPADRVHPVPLGVAPRMHPPPADAVADLRRRLGLNAPYLLTVGTLEPRKNIPFLVTVFERLAEQWPGLFVLAGAPGWNVGPILERLTRSPAAARIRRLDFVADPDLPALYGGAACFLCASHYEGFGLPPLEAMACGTPVIASPGGALREVLAPGAAALLDPDDPDRWTASIRTLLDSPEARQAAVETGLARARQFTWPETARRTWAVYRKAGAA